MTENKWTIKITMFNTYTSYDILEPDSKGKMSVQDKPYRQVCECESLQDAELIVSLHNDGIKALKKAKSYIETITHYQNISPMDVINKVLNKLEEK